MQYITINDQDQIINGVNYNAQSANKDWSIKKSIDSKSFRFGVNQGEGRPSSDEGKERAELSSGDIHYPHRTNLWTSYSFKVEDGDKFTGSANVIGQFHGGVDSPNLSIRLPYDRTLRIYLRTGDSDNYTQFIPYTKDNFVRGSWYNIVMNTKFTSDNSGFIKIWINGLLVVNLSNMMTGYLESQSTYNYFKFGIYRSTSIPQNEVVYYSNIEYGINDLNDRILNPLTITG